jgi:hypothetical protein
VGESRRNGEAGKGRNGELGERIKSYKDLRVFQNAMDSAMNIFQITKGFPPDEIFHG